MTTPNTSGNEGQHSGGGFTPGPLSFYDSSEDDPHVGLFRWDVYTPGKASTAHCRRKADAQLYAAAPDLLEAVQRAIRHAINIGIDDEGSSYFRQLRQAEAKALGTAPGSVGEGSRTDDKRSQSQPLADAGPCPRSHDNHSFDGKEDQ